MSLDAQGLQQIQVENVLDYAQYISQVASLDPSLQTLQGIHGLQALPDGTTVAFIDSSVLDASQIFENAAIEVHQALPEGSVDLQQCHQVVLEQPVLDQMGLQQTAIESLDVKPPIGKGPFNCSLCDKIFNKWNQLQRHLKTHDEDKPFRCNQCPMSYNIEDNLLLHLATHVGPDRDPICPECGKKFSRVASLKAHIMLHEKEESLMCPECGDEFSVQHQLDRHLQEHRTEQEGIRIYQCRQCNQEYSKLSALREHMKQHYKVKASLHHRAYKRNVDRTGFIHECKHCHKTFQKPSQLERHERIHTGERPFICQICQKTFNQKGALQMHMTKHTGERPHTCTFCPMTFAQKGNLRSHIKRVHTLNKDETSMVYKCDECSCMFRRLGSLNAHISRAHADPGETNQTTVQDIKLSEQHSLQQLADMSDSSMMQDVLGLDHVHGTSDLTSASLVDGQVIHGSLDQGASDILQQALENSGLPSSVVEDQEVDASKDLNGAAAVASGSLASTITTTSTGITTRSNSGGLPRLSTMAVHDSATGLLKRHYTRKVNGIRWHQCTYCTKEFKKPSDLVRHIRIHTHEKPYKCTQCFRAFAVKSTLTAHIKTHTGVKDFRCEVCNKMFSTQGSLKVHLRLHTGAKPFDCTQCEKKFRTSAHCKSHIQSHFKDPDNMPRTRRALKRPSRHDALLTDIPLQEPILITDTGLIQQPPRNSMFPPFATESNNLERPYKCPHCRRGFKKSSHLKQHIRSHTGERPFRCNLCLRSFVSSGVLKAHARTHSGVKSHRCLVCDAMFTTGGSLKRHMSTHSEVRPFMCPYCQKTFKTSVNCKKHMKTHRHELAMQHYQTVKEGDGAGEDGDVDGRGDEDGEIVEEDGLSGPQTLADLDVLQEQDIGHTTTVTQPELQVVEMNQQDLQSAGVTADSLSLDSGLQQAFGQGMFSHNFTLVNQQPFVQLNTHTSSQGQEDKSREPGDEVIPRVTVQLEGQMGGQVSSSMSRPISNQASTQFTYQPANWKSNVETNFTNQQAATISVIDENVSVQQGHEIGDEGNLQDGILEDEEEEEEEEEEDEEEEDEEEETSHQLSSVSAGSSSIGRRGFRCHICSKIFKKSGHLSIHLKQHSGSGSFQCPECSKSFGSALVLKNHLRSHAGIKPHMCSLCNAAFSTAGSLRRHMMQHTAKNYQCALCNEELKNAAQLRRHMKDCRVNVVPSMPMTKANDENQAPAKRISMTRRRSLMMQQQLFSAEQVSISQKILMESASEKDRISMPKDVHNQTIRRGRFINMCAHCPKSFKKPSDLQRHLRIHTGEKPFICQICHRSFTVKSTLDSHMRTHKAAEKSFLCHVCNSMFSTKGSLKVHMRLHTGAKPFRCLHCDQRFRTSGHRKSHMTAHFRISRESTSTTTTTTTTTTSKKTPKVQALMTMSQESNVPQQMFILTSNQQTNAQTPAPVVNQQQMITVDQQLTNQVVGIEQQPTQVISIDQSLLQNSGMMPIQLAVNDGQGTDAATGLPSQVLQGLDGSFQLHITAPLNQLGQNFQLSGVDPNLLQQTVQIDASVLQQLQQNGFITINAGGIQPTLTADLSQVGADLGQVGVGLPSSIAVSSGNLIGQSMTGSDSVIVQHALQAADGSQMPEGLMGQSVQTSDALISQIQSSESLLVQSVRDSVVVNSQQQVEAKGQSGLQSQELIVLPAHTSSQVVARRSDTLLSQPTSRMHTSAIPADSLIGQSVHVSQDSYMPQGAVQVSDAMLGHDHLLPTTMSVSESMMGRQLSHGMASSDAVMRNVGEHTLLQGIQLQPVSMSEAVNPNVIVQSMANLQSHQGVKSQGAELENTTYVTVDGQQLAVQTVNHNTPGTEMELVKMEEDDPKFSIPGDDTRMVNITHLDQNPSMGHHGNPMDDEDDEEEEEEEEEDVEEVDTNALIPTAEVVNLSKRQQEGSERQHICGICFKGFKRAAHLREHMHTHGPGPVPKKPKATPHRCNVCQKAFQKPSQVERHMRIHTGERPFTCHICTKAFNQKNALQVHLRKHSGDKPHACPYCSSSFVQSGNLKTHIKRAHHADMVSSMNLDREQHGQHHGQQHMGLVPSVQGDSTMGGEVNVGVVDGMEHPGMDLVEVVDLFAH